jgi:ketosteroid isomerase-like protein
MAVMPMLGDVLPDSLRHYYAALDDGRTEEAVEAFADDVVYALPPGAGGETSPRVIRTGRDAVLGALRERRQPDRRHEIQLCGHEKGSCLLEGVVSRADGTRLSTFAASAQLDDAGLVSRYLAYQCSPPVDAAPTDRGRSPADALDGLDRYFHALDDGDFAAAAQCFSPDVVYMHPPYRHTGIDGDERVVFRGRDHLLAAFEARGRQSFDHMVLVGVQRGAHAIVEGVVTGLAAGGTGSFLSSLSLDGDGRIQRYMSFYCEPSVPRL